MHPKLKTQIDSFIAFTRRWYSILLIAAGFLGFLIIDVVMFQKGNMLKPLFGTTTKPSFQEVTILKDSIFLGLQNQAIKCINSDTTLKNKKPRIDSVQYIKEIFLGLSQTGKDSVFANQVVYKNKPSKNYLLSNKVDIAENDSIQLWSKDSAIFAINPTLKPAYKCQYRFPLHLQAATSNVAFITKYPAFGVWAILIFVMIISSSMVCIIIPSSLYMLKNRVSSLNITLQPYRALKTVFFFIAGLGLFFWVAYRSFFDTLSFNGNLFIHGYTKIYVTVCLIGYFATAICFTAFLVCAHYMFLILEDDIDLTPNAYPPENDATDANNKANRDKAAAFTQKLVLLKSYFNLYLIIIAISFGLMVIATGTLFTAFNGLDFIQAIQQTTHQPFLPFDGLFLYAGMHSFLLLLFFVPVKITMMQVEAMYNQNQHIINNVGTGSNTWRTFASNLINLFKDLLIPASPLIAGLLQKFIESFLK